jgi:hypothetical protein
MFIGIQVNQQVSRARHAFSTTDKKFVLKKFNKSSLISLISHEQPYA